MLLSQDEIFICTTNDYIRTMAMINKKIKSFYY
jgi:hypothetical protein